MATQYWWLIEKPDTDGSSLYLTMLPGINQTAFRSDPWKATRFKRQADAEHHASTFYKTGFGVRAVEHAFDAPSSGSRLKRADANSNKTPPQEAP